MSGWILIRCVVPILNGDLLCFHYLPFLGFKVRSVCFYMLVTHFYYIFYITIILFNYIIHISLYENDNIRIILKVQHVNEHICFEC